MGVCGRRRPYIVGQSVGARFGAEETVRASPASNELGASVMARRPNAAVGVVCPRCGMLAARIIGRSESLPVIYLQCEDCGRTSVAPSGEQA